MQETQVQSLSWEDPLEKEMTNHSSIFTWEIPWTEEHGGLQSMGLRKSRTSLSDYATTTDSFNPEITTINAYASYLSRYMHIHKLMLCN